MISCPALATVSPNVIRMSRAAWKVSSFGRCVGGDRLFVGPVPVGGVMNQAAIVFHAGVDQVGDGTQAGVAELFLEILAVTDVGEQRRPVMALGCAAPVPFAAGGLEVAQGANHALQRHFRPLFDIWANLPCCIVCGGQQDGSALAGTEVISKTFSPVIAISDAWRLADRADHRGRNPVEYGTVKTGTGRAEGVLGF